MSKILVGTSVLELRGQGSTGSKYLSKKSVLQKVYFLNLDFPNFQMCHRKLGISLENKAIQKLKLSQNANNEKKVLLSRYY